MIDISVSNLVKEFEVGHKILDGLTFQVDTGERVGLLGPNGCGKTTLLRILTGVLDYDEGDVVIAPGKRMGLISQIPVYPAGYTVEDVLATAFAPLRKMEEEMAALTEQMGEGSDPALLSRYDRLTAAYEAAGGYETDTRTNKVCNGLSIPQSMREQLFDKLSGGEKTRVNLARLILEDTDILLLDEPTNHLDLRATEWLEEYLEKFKGTVLTVSHDRYFLDQVVDRIVEIQEGRAEFYEGNYSFYAVEKERRYEEKLRQYEKEQAKIEQLEKAAAQMRIWAYSGMDKTFKRVKSMEKRIERMRVTDRPKKERKMEVRFGEREFRGDEVLTIKGLTKSFGDRTLFANLGLEVEGGERIALIGDNGTGKSTLINTLLGSAQRTGAVSDKYNRGRHTTNHSLYLEKDGIRVIDTPGVREIEVPFEDLSAVRESFPEFSSADCFFQGCLHHGEDGCALPGMVEDGRVSPERYESYLRILQALEERKPLYLRNKRK